MEEENEFSFADEPAVVRYAGFWMRFWAYLVDLLIVFSVTGILLSPFKFMEGAPFELGIWSVTGILGSLIFYIYFLLMTKICGQTVGKMILGIRVIREDNQALLWRDLLFREVVGRFLHRVFFFTFLLYIVVAFSPKKQGIHDRLGNTRVIIEDG